MKVSSATLIPFSLLFSLPDKSLMHEPLSRKLEIPTLEAEIMMRDFHSSRVCLQLTVIPMLKFSSWTIFPIQEKRNKSQLDLIYLEANLGSVFILMLKFFYNHFIFSLSFSFSHSYMIPFTIHSVSYRLQSFLYRFLFTKLIIPLSLFTLTTIFTPLSLSLPIYSFHLPSFHPEETIMTHPHDAHYYVVNN